MDPPRDVPFSMSIPLEQGTLLLPRFLAAEASRVFRIALAVKSLFRCQKFPSWRATRLAHHQLEGNQQIDSRPRWVLHAIEHHLNGGLADLIASMADRCERHGE